MADTEKHTLCSDRSHAFTRRDAELAIGDVISLDHCAGVCKYQTVQSFLAQQVFLSVARILCTARFTDHMAWDCSDTWTSQTVGDTRLLDSGFAYASNLVIAAVDIGCVTFEYYSVADYQFIEL